jgi:hypothetical protein
VSTILKSRRTLASINSILNLGGEEYTHFKAESQVMHTLASNIESLLHVSYRRFFSVRKNIIYEMGTQAMLLPYINMDVPDLDFDARRLLAERYSEIHGHKPTLESLTSFLDAGKKYLQMQAFCKNNANSIYIHELCAPSAESAQPIVEQLFYDSPIMVHSDIPEFIGALVQYVLSVRQTASIDSVAFPKSNYLLNMNQTICIAGDNARNAFSQYIAAIKDKERIEGASYKHAQKVRLPSTTLKTWAVESGESDKTAEDEFESIPTDVSYPPPLEPVIVSRTAEWPAKKK